MKEKDNRPNNISYMGGYDIFFFHRLGGILSSL